MLKLKRVRDDAQEKEPKEPKTDVGHSSQHSGGSRTVCISGAATDDAVPRKKRKTPRGRRPTALGVTYTPPLRDSSYFEKQTPNRYDCGQHAINNLLGFQLMTRKNLTDAALFISKSKGTPSTDEYDKHTGEWSIDALEYVASTHGYQLRAWEAARLATKEILTRKGLYLCQAPPPQGEEMSHWIGVDGERNLILDSLSPAPVERCKCELVRRRVWEGFDCRIYTLQRVEKR